MVRPPCCDKLNVKKGPWSAEEDAKILACVSKHGTGNWNDIPKKAGLKRCGKSCRLRWTNYLRPDIKHDNFTPQEEELIISLHAAIGSRWSIIAQQLPGRTDNDVKNFWNTKLRKKLCKMGIDHVTHKPFSKILTDYGSINGLQKPETRIGSLTRDLKKAYIFKPEAYQFVPKAASDYQDSCSSIDLLSQLQAVRLITEASISRNHLLGEENLSSSSSSSSLSSTSSSSTGSTTAFNWQDYLLLQSDQPQPDQGEENLWLNMETSSDNGTSGQVKSALMLEQNHEEVETGPGLVLPSFDVERCSSSAGDGFVEAMLVRENQMFSDFAHLLMDTFDD